MKRILAIHDLSGVGKCSLTVALPVISAAGIECSCMPTAVLSTHTGEFKGYTVHDLTSEMEPMAEHWLSEGVKFDGIYSGYMTSPEQVKVLLRVIHKLRGEDTMFIVDPAMADNGCYYAGLDERMCQAFREVVSQADVITPNITEAALLAGVALPEKRPYPKDFFDTLLEKLMAMGPKIIAITGVHPEGDASQVGMIAMDRQSGKVYTAFRPERDGFFYGTGDLFASAFSALLVRGAGTGDALDIAAWLVGESIERSMSRNAPRRFGVDFELALPGFMERVSGC